MLKDISLSQSKQSLEIFKFFASVQFALLGGGQIFSHFSPCVIHYCFTKLYNNPNHNPAVTRISDNFKLNFYNLIKTSFSRSETFYIFITTTENESFCED